MNVITAIKRIQRRNPALFGFGAAVIFLGVASLFFRLAFRILILVLILAAVQWVIDLLHRFRDTRQYRD
jgi:hypothetical protein